MVLMHQRLAVKAEGCESREMESHRDVKVERC